MASKSITYGPFTLFCLQMMAKRDQELEEIRAKTIEEINEEAVDLKGELFMLHLQISVRNEFKSSEFRRMCKRVLDKAKAVMVTVNIALGDGKA
ncbi:hypothetical protein JRO89_XS11G0143500 [Xanthoceras sorbifolium]|uniref:Large ribosomal subunit protein uL29c n=1 Tax=Xanthoceras sorbifolium TaxID=99658 RepID=A0ABQ8HFL0_9ROSI|nr:hypothetical protein JRO89_XS11G0143500 [Xanthoceras sorbifolium]